MDSGQLAGAAAPDEPVYDMQVGHTHGSACIQMSQRAITPYSVPVCHQFAHWLSWVLRPCMVQQQQAPARRVTTNKCVRAHMQASAASPGLPSSPGQLKAGSNKPKAARPSKIPTGGSLSPSTSSKGSKFPSDPLAATGSANALVKMRSQREKPSSIPAVSSSITANVAATISKAKEALAQARARQAAAAASNAGLASGHSSRVVDGAVFDKPFTLYGKVEPPPPKPPVQLHPPDAEEVARRK